jgi:hypothetical protein
MTHGLEKSDRLIQPKKLSNNAEKSVAEEDVVVVRFCDDFIVGFQHRFDAEQFLVELKERFQKFSLELHPEKTRLIEFGRYAASDRQLRKLGKPETFDFLGLTHICGKPGAASSRSSGRRSGGDYGRN